jgi:hypothetical protein
VNLMTCRPLRRASWMAWLLSWAVAGGAVWGEPAPATFENPVVSGFASDPSVCRSGEDYYLVTSTFEYLPGLPVYHSQCAVA